MRQVHYNRHNHAHLRVLPPTQPMYPNAADPGYFTQKALDVITAVISCAGFISAMCFLITML